MKRYLLWISCIYGILLIQPDISEARQVILHRAPAYFVTGQESEIRFSVSGLQPSESIPAFVLYRETGQPAYRRVRALPGREEYVAQLSTGNVQSTAVEYYIEIENLPGGTITFPESSPEEFPVTVELIDPDEVVTYNRTGIAHGIEYTILSPIPGERIPYFDTVIAVAIYSEPDIDSSSIGIRLNSRDVTKQAEITNRFISYIPPNMTPGMHTAEIYLSGDGDESLTVVTWTFTVYDPDAPATGQTPIPFFPNGAAELAYRNQSYDGRVQNVLSGQVRMFGNEGDWRYSLSSYLTSEETPRLQARNRYSADLEYRNLMRVAIGDLYPDMNPFMISGRRVFGVSAIARTLKQNVNVYFLLGRLNRSVNVRYGEIEKQYLQISENITDSVYVLAPRSPGTAYRRDILATRLEFGNNRPLRFGLNMMRVQDAAGSIRLFNSIDELPQHFLNSPAGQEALQNPDMFRLQHPGVKPQGNFVLASDIQVNADQNRIQFQSDVAASLLNYDITPGVLTAERAEELGYTIDETASGWLNRLSWFIIINENMNAIPFRLQDEEGDAFVPTGIFANQNRLFFNYFNHSLSIQYRWIGPDYNSLASTGIRRDNSGFLISDRVRYLNNTLFITGSYERYHDNVINNRISTTLTQGFRLNASWLPRDRALPNISIGINYQTRGNGVDRHNPFFDGEPRAVRNAAIRNIYIVSGDTVAAATPRDNNTLQLTGSVTRQFEWMDAANEASFSISNILTRDNMFYYGDFNSLNLSLGLRSILRSMPMRTNLNLSYNNSESLSGLNTTRITGINAAVSYDFFERRLNVYSEIGYAYRTTDIQNLRIESIGQSLSIFNNFYVPDPESVVRIESNSYIIRAGSRYDISWNHAVALDVNYNNVVSAGGFAEIPNDRYAQIRYIFNF